MEVKLDWYFDISAFLTSLKPVVRPNDSPKYLNHQLQFYQVPALSLDLLLQLCRQNVEKDFFYGRAGSFGSQTNTLRLSRPNRHFSCRIDLNFFRARCNRTLTFSTRISSISDISLWVNPNISNNTKTIFWESGKKVTAVIDF